MDAIILAHFKKHDPVLYKIAVNIKQPFITKISENYFASLCESIISQQLSVKVGDVMYHRFENLLEGVVTPEQVLKHSVAELRALGISLPKASYILDLAQKVYSKEIHLEKLKGMTEQEVIDELTKVKGIGQWTAEMFLMFSLGRDDVFSTGDLALKRAVEQLYNLENPSKTLLLEMSSKWSPYRTYASRILWYSLK
ncbi:MAG TPA: DNA-3-methyladenine glycosylase [Candidatus Woesebacteria bacterium]|nr:DNA-3-methyladenine glycosylase [Candidatus Woesebacteria bacterium]